MNSKTRDTICAVDGCSNVFEKAQYTRRKYCDGCANARDNRNKRKKVPVIDHKDGCYCGGCMGVESRRK